MRINIINDLNSYKEVFKKYNLIKKDINFYQTFDFISTYYDYYKINYIFT